MKFPLAPILAANVGVAAFQQVHPGIFPRASSSAARTPANHNHGSIQRRRASTSPLVAQMAESLAELDASVAPDEPVPTTTAGGAEASIGAAGATDAPGEILALQSSPHGSFAVVKVCEEELQLPSTLTADGVGVTDGSVPLAGEGEERVELADALFGGSGGATQSKKDEKGVIADGDLTGRTVTFPDSSTGVVVAHRHPIAFVLMEGQSGGSEEKDCSISTKLASLDPASIPPGSTVDYLGRHVAVLHDGSVGRSLPKASAEFDLSTGSGIGSADGIHLSVDTEELTDGHASKSERPIFVPIPKISDIGLIDSPLVTGIAAVDALTPIGKGQNMLVIGKEETLAEEREKGGVNIRGWMINLLRNVVKGHQGNGDNMRCFYGLTSPDGAVRSRVLKGIEEAGIQDDVVTVVSSRDKDLEAQDAVDGISTKKALEAGEAVAVAAAACTLGEHHALSTGGDAVVVIDDINLQKALWDITTQQLVQVYGAEAVVEADLQGGSSSEMRGFFSGLIQRAARFNAKNGGGSVTLLLLSRLPNPEAETADDEERVFDEADFSEMSEKIQDRIGMLVKAKVPLTPANLRKIQIPVPRPSASEDAKRLALQHAEDLISMSDGQLWLDEELAKAGRSPPLDPTRSMTRVGVGADTLTCRADAPALRSLVGSLRYELQQAADVLESGASSIGDAKELRRRDAFLLAMHQEPSQARTLSQECIALLAASRGQLDAVLAKGASAGTAEGRDAIEGLLTFVEKEAGEIARSIDETLDLSGDERAVLEEAIASYFEERN